MRRLFRSLLALMVGVLSCTSAGPTPSVSVSAALQIVPLTPISNSEVVFNRPVVQWINPFSPAGAAGLRVGDRVLRVGAANVVTVADLYAAQAKTLETDQTSLTITRGGHEATLKLTTAREDSDLGFSVYPFESVYVMVGFPNFPERIHFVSFRDLTITAYGGAFRLRPEIAFLRIAIANRSSGAIKCPTAVSAVGSHGELLRLVSPQEVVNALLPRLGRETASIAPPPPSPPIYVGSPGSQYFYPVPNYGDALANLVTAIGNIAIEAENARIRNRESARSSALATLSGQLLRPAVLPGGSLARGDVFVWVNSSQRPFQLRVQVAERWFSFTFS